MRRIAVTLCSALIIPHAAYADGILGGGIGYYNNVEHSDLLRNGDDVEFEHSSWKVFGGLDFGRILALEGGYIDFGEATDGVNGLKATGWTAAGILALPITDNFAPYAKAGQLFWNSDFLVGSITVSEDGNDFFYGAGIRYALYQRLDLRLEYERFTMDHGNDEIDMDMASLNMQLRF